MPALSAVDLLLDEAQETDNDSYDSAAEDEFYNGQDPADKNPYKGRVFHIFSQLPPELRIRVWELALGEEAQPRILHFDLGLTHRPMDPGDEVDIAVDWTVQPSKGLAVETQHVRRIIAVNREARDVVLKTLPHTLKLRSGRTGRGPATVYFHRDRDVAYIGAGDYFAESLRFQFSDIWHDVHCDFEGFAENVTQLAINCRSLEFVDEFDDQRLYGHILEPLSNLKRLFLHFGDCDDLRRQDMIWAGSDYVYTRTVAIRDRGNGHFLKEYVWPNADDYDDFARQLPVPTITALGLPSQKRLMQLAHGAVVLPMFVFEDRGGYKALEKLRAIWHKSYSRGIPVEELSDLSSDSGTGGDDDIYGRLSGDSESDEYESDGIDDSAMMEYGTDDDSDEDNLSGDQVYGDDDDNEDGDGDDGDSGSDAINGNRNANTVPTEDAPAFSSPEPEPTSASGTQNSRKRRIVADSDDELPSEGSRRKHARNGGFSAVITSDTDDEGVGETGAARKRRRRAAVVDSDDEVDDTGDDRNSDKGKGKGGTGGESDRDSQEDGDDSDDDDDDEEEEDAVEQEKDKEEEVVDVRRLSLATRLQLVPPRHRSSLNKRDDSTDEDEDEDDEGDEDDEDDDDDERSEDELIDGIAEESDTSD